PGTAIDIASQVAPGSLRWYGEGCPIEPIVSGLFRRIDRYARNQVRPLVPAVAIRHVRCFPGHRDVYRETGPRRQNSTQLPSADQVAHDAAGVPVTPPRSDRKLVHRIYREAVSNVEVCGAP